MRLLSRLARDLYTLFFFTASMYASVWLFKAVGAGTTALADWGLIDCAFVVAAAWGVACHVQREGRDEG